jgi:hypothetical protein
MAELRIAEVAEEEPPAARLKRPEEMAAAAVEPRKEAAGP